MSAAEIEGVALIGHSFNHQRKMTCGSNATEEEVTSTATFAFGSVRVEKMLCCDFVMDRSVAVIPSAVVTYRFKVCDGKKKEDQMFTSPNENW